MDLPEFVQPPVVEVVMSVQFEELSSFQPVHFGLLWERWRSRYPLTSHHAPIAPSVELDGAKGFEQASISFEETFPVGRCWYQSVDKHSIVQVQPNRFTFNWRKIDDGTEYPRYEQLKELFRAELAVFQSFLRDNDLGSVAPTQCELTYVNHLPQGIGWTRQADLHLVLSTWEPTKSGGLLPDIEGARLAWHYRFVDGESLLGRLYVQVQSARKKDDDTPLIVLQMIARGNPIGEGTDGVFSFAERAHEWIVRGFAEITTSHMHTVWGRSR
ncbi:MAG: TIGR04255 family protein [Gemmatimonadaceae bacterium]|nr:TIGR04255 family protein [Gemmatimonadaceae bacterium]